MHPRSTAADLGLLPRVGAAISGGWYLPIDAQMAAAALAGADLALAAPFPADMLATWALAIGRVTTGQSGAQLKMGVWACNASLRPIGLPLAWNNGPFGLSSAGLVTVAFNAALANNTPRWLAFVSIGSHTTAPSMISLATNTAPYYTARLGAPSAGASINSSGFVTGLTSPVPFSTDLSTLDLTGAVWTPTAAGVPQWSLQAA